MGHGQKMPRLLRLKILFESTDTCHICNVKIFQGVPNFEDPGYPGNVIALILNPPLRCLLNIGILSLFTS
jgi:hypothetical protein